MTSHATGCQSDIPTFAQIKELFAQIDSGRITKERMQDFLRAPSPKAVTVWGAKEILGEKNVFGPEEWKKYFFQQLDPSAIPPIPWNFAELENPGINQDHFLFLGITEFKGHPLTLSNWYDFVSIPSSSGRSNFYTSHRFSRIMCEARWYLMPVGMAPKSQGISYKDQVKHLEGYVVPSAVERVIANDLYFMLHQTFLDPEYWVRTRDQTDDGQHISVRQDNVYDNMGRDFDGFSKGRIGVAASLKLP
jgi:hypothetical protein